MEYQTDTSAVISPIPAVLRLEINKLTFHVSVKSVTSWYPPI
ncbi:hypothetical protein [Bacillus sp. 3255]|nr:hypothetical protein [Bacillus sp. 3255]